MQSRVALPVSKGTSFEFFAHVVCFVKISFAAGSIDKVETIFISSKFSQ
jgi:hypothetical protein